MKLHFAALAVPLVVGLACAEHPTAPTAARTVGPITAQKTKGTGLILNSVTGLSLPLIGSLGDVTINQAEITNFAIVENTVGQIVGLQADGVLQLTGGVLGSQVISQDFSTTVAVTSSGPGQCGVVTLDLAPININLLAAQVDVPAASIAPKASGALGPLLCNLGQALLQPVADVVRQLVQSINNLI
ncbi:MAG TPA: hypothetical protein VL549_07960 [Gemmatimonadales bacterium]|jgi:hypothetical protein|nr:hypothetical protein [Gemmatimonadales bacterium]